MIYAGGQMPTIIYEYLKKKRIPVRPIDNNHIHVKSKIGDIITHIKSQKTPVSINQSYEQLKRIIESVPLFMQRDYNTLKFPVFLYLAKSLAEQGLIMEFESFISRYRFEHPKSKQKIIDDFILNPGNYKIPNTPICISEFTYNDMIIKFGKKQSQLLTTIIFNFLNINIVPFTRNAYENLEEFDTVAKIDEESKKFHILNPGILNTKQQAEVSSETTGLKFNSDILHMTLFNHNNAVSDMAISKCGRLFAYAYNSTVNINLLTPYYDFQNRCQSVDIFHHNGRACSVGFSSNSAMIISGGFDGCMRMAETEISTEIARFSHHMAPVISVGFLPNSYFAWGASIDRTLSLWTLESPIPVRMFVGHSTPVIRGVALSRELIVSTSVDGTMILWDIGSGKSIAKTHVEGKPTSICGSPNCNLAVGTESGKVTLFGTNCERLWEIEMDSPVLSMEFCNDFLIAGDADGFVKGFSVSDGSKIFETQAPASSIDYITTLHDNKVLTAGRSLRK